MIEEVRYPLIRRAETKSGDWVKLQYEAKKKLQGLFNRGYAVVSKNVVNAKDGDYEVIVLYRRPKSRNNENGAAPAVEDQNHAA